MMLELSLKPEKEIVKVEKEETDTPRQKAKQNNSEKHRANAETRAQEGGWCKDRVVVASLSAGHHRFC